MFSRCITVPAIALCFIFSCCEGQHFVTYVDALLGWQDEQILESIGCPGYCQSNPYNVINLAFWNSMGEATDALLVWSEPELFLQPATIDKIANVSNATDDQFRSGLISRYHANGIKVLASAFGSTDYPTSTHDPTQLGIQIAEFIKTNQLDGVDIDWEDNNALQSGIYTFYTFMICCFLCLVFLFFFCKYW